jgi:hypothetical protein
MFFAEDEGYIVGVGVGVEDTGEKQMKTTEMYPGESFSDFGVFKNLRKKNLMKLS